MSDGFDLLEEQQPTAPRKPVPAPKKDAEQKTVDACKPDEWDETGRLISNVLINPEHSQTRRGTFTNDEKAG